MFSEDNRIIRALTRVFDLMLLNILFVLCSLPIITIGASLTALYSVTLKMVENEENYIAKGFLSAFRSNFAQSTVVWVVLLIIGGLLGADMMLISNTTGMLHLAGLLVFGMFGLAYLMEAVFVFPLIARFVNTTPNMIKNGFLIPVSRLPLAFAIIIMDGCFVYLTLFNQTTILIGTVFWSIIGIALLSYGNAFLINRMFNPFIRED